MVEAVISFLDKLKKFKNTWSSIETKVLAAKVEGRWINLGTVIKLSFKDKKEEEREIFRLQDSIVIFHRVERFDFDKFGTFLKNLAKSITIRNIEIFSEGFTSFHHIKKEKENWKEDRITDTFPWPAYLLRCYGKHPKELLENFDEINEKLRLNVEPYEDTSDLSSNYLFTVGGAYVTAIYVIAPIYIRFEKSMLSSSGKIKFNIIYHKSLETKNLKMNVILASADTKVDRFQLLFEREYRAEGDFFVIEKSVERNLVDIESARIYLSFEDELIRRDWITVIGPLDEEELRKNIQNAIQNLRKATSNVNKVLEQIDNAVFNNVINIEDNVRDKSVWNDLGFYFMENGCYSIAELIYRRMIQTIMKYEKDRKKRIHKGLASYNLASALLYQNKTEEAKKAFALAYNEDKLTYGPVEAERMPAREALRKYFKE